MAYSDSIQRLKDMLDGYSAESGKLETLYKAAIENAEKSKADAKKALDEQHYRDRNEAYADTAQDERNTMNMLAARGLGFSGEAAQAKLNSNVLLAERLGSLTREKAQAENDLDLTLAEQKNAIALDAAEKQSALNKNYADIAADIAKTELDAEQESARLKAEKEMQRAELNAKYGDTSGSSNTGGSVTGGNISIDADGELGGILNGFDPEVTPKELAKLLVTSATDDGYIRSDYDKYLINRYMLELYDNYTLPDDYMDELVFMLKAYGYPAPTRSEMRVQVISREAKAYYEDRYKSIFDSAVLSGNHELLATNLAGKTAREDVMKYIYSRTENDSEFLECCIAAGVPEAEANAYIEALSPREEEEETASDTAETKKHSGGGSKFIYSSLK